MLYYVLIGLCFSLVGVAGLQLMYLLYLDRIDKEKRKHITALEHLCRDLQDKLDAASEKIADQETVIDNLEVIYSRREEAWADVLEEN